MPSCSIRYSQISLRVGKAGTAWKSRSIGTSAFVTPARWLIPIARRAGALCVNVNLDDDTPYEDDFHAHVVGDCQKTVPAWLIDA